MAIGPQFPINPGDAPDIEFVPDADAATTPALPDEILVGDVAGPGAAGLVDIDAAEYALTPEEIEQERDFAAMSQFDANLALFFDEDTLAEMSSKLMESYRMDMEARKPRDDQYAEGIKQTGFGQPAPGGANFDGASRVTHPVMGEASIDFAASASKELLPPEGPVRIRIVTDADPEAAKLAERKKRYMNHLLTSGCPEFYGEHEQMLSQLGISGDGYIKLWWESGGQSGLRCEFINQSRVYLPYSASDWRTAQRRSVVYNLDDMEIQVRVAEGMYRPEPFESMSADIPETSEVQDANAKVEGKTKPGENKDGTRRLIEMYVFYDMEGDDPLLAGQNMEDGLEIPNRPGWYQFTIDEQTEKVASIYRVWDAQHFELTGAVREQIDIVHYGFIPWEGAYHIGFAHVLSGLSKSITGALRALHDAGLIKNQPSGLRLKGGRNSGESIRVNPTEIAELDGVATDDIRKVFMPLPFNGPDAVLYNLLGMMIETARGIVTTSEEKIADATAQGPVGTTVALIEQGSKVMSSVHARLHRSMAEELSIIHRLIGENLQPGEVEIDTGYEMITPEEFQGPVNIIPVSDPHIFAESQRYAILTEVAKMVEQPIFAELDWDRDALARRFLNMLRLPNAEEILPPEPSPEPTNAIDENAAMVTGQLQQVFPEQDHAAHLQLHLQFLTSPIFGRNRVVAKTLLPLLLQHIKDHLAFFYAQTMGNVLQQQGGQPVDFFLNQDMQEGSDLTSSVFAQVGIPGMQAILQTLGDSAPLLDQAYAFNEEINPTLDQIEILKGQSEAMQAEAQASQMEAEVKAIEASRKEDRDDAKAASDIQATQREQDRKDYEASLTEQRVEIEEQRAAIEAQRVEVEKALGELRILADNVNKARDRQLDREIHNMDNASRERMAEERSDTELVRSAMQQESKQKTEKRKLKKEGE